MIDAPPLPAHNGPYEAGFWAALQQGRLAHQRCTRCRRWHFPPRRRCGYCGGALSYETVSGRGRLWSYTVVHRPVLPAFEALVPYVAAIVELEEQAGLRMTGNIVSTPGDPINRIKPSGLFIGMRLKVILPTQSDESAWPTWMPAAD